MRLTTALCVLPLLAAGCLGPSARPGPGDPTVLLRTPGGDELGVSTDYGVLFLGRGAQSGPVDLTAWFADGPSWEAGSITDLGGGLFVTRPEIRLATVPFAFEETRRGQEVTVRGRRGGTIWETETEVVTHPQVEGLLLRATDRLRAMRDDEVGAGVFVGDPEERRLVGLVSGRLLLETAEGSREFITVLGPRELWRAVLESKGGPEPPPWVYRDDIL